MLPARYFLNNKSYSLCIPRGLFFFFRRRKHLAAFSALSALSSATSTIQSAESAINAESMTLPTYTASHTARGICV